MKNKKTKKFLVFVCFAVILGSIITAAMDHSLGISFANVGVVAEIAHKLAYALWGAAILEMSKCFES